ncbi:hypothetical protein NQ315_002258 [Exocentrus adspersus]|uniref:Uncharacterized protein n=1 Tax=Exocentrus adspersus TaxID=1586481 RepID=A0AAV8VTI4_9CUCU|nr:hypothetical protein NQ315_002258 [Exocentrus adspersus]
MFSLQSPNPHQQRLLYIICFCLVKTVSGNYCEFGICEEDQYCCGDNRCCKITVPVWYFWAGVLLIVIAVFVAICLYIGRNKSNNGYKRVLSEEQEAI